MDNWLALLQNPIPIKSIYADFVPALRNVNLHEVIIHRDGPKVALRFDLTDFPESPPREWENFNTVQVCLVMYEVKKLSINGFRTTCMLDFNIQKYDDSINFIASGDDVDIYIISSFALVDKVSAYRNV
jgi:hypothetical protein